MARHSQPVIFTPFTLAGAMAPVTIAGALVQQNAEALAGIAFVQCVRAGRAGDLWRLHLQRRHEERGAGLRHAGIRQGDARRRPARAALRTSPTAPPTPTPPTRPTRRRPTNREMSIWPACWRTATWSSTRRLDGGRALRLLREDHPRRRDAADDGRLRSSRSIRRGRARHSTRCARSARAATFSGGATRWRATRPRSMRRCCRTGAISRPGRRPARSTPRGAPTGSGRSCSPPTSRRRSTRRVAEEIAAFVARRKEEGGAPTN